MDISSPKTQSRSARRTPLGVQRNDANDAKFPRENSGLEISGGGGVLGASMMDDGDVEQFDHSMSPPEWWKSEVKEER